MINKVLTRNRVSLLVILMMALALSVWGQNKIGDHPTSIQPGSLLELESLSKGFRLPRITLNDVNTWAPLDGLPVSGMLIFNENGSSPKGMYYWSTDSVKWVRLLNAAELSALIQGSTTVSNAVVVNTLTTTVNGVSSIGEDIIKNNSLTIVNGILTSTVNGVPSSPGLVLTAADNGLSQTNGKVQLGGSLVQPTELYTSATNTLSVKGLQEGDVAADSALVVTPTSGVVKKVKLSMSGVNQYRSVILATAGQLVFPTPTGITDIKKIQVFRNGISVECTLVDSNHIQLESDAACYANDEIKIIQLI